MRTTRRFALLLLAVAALATATAPAWADGVAPGAAPAPDDIRDIRGPLHMPEPTAWEGWVVGGLAVVLAAIAGAVLLRRHRRRRPLEVWEVALRKLDDARALMESENAYAFAIAMSEAVRTYLEKRYDMSIIHQTTPEFLGCLARDERGPLRPWREDLQGFLDHCDLAKYARGDLARERMEAMHTSARRLVMETRPQPERRHLVARLPWWRAPASCALAAQAEGRSR